MEETADLAMEQEAFKAEEGVRKKHKIVFISLQTETKLGQRLWCFPKVRRFGEYKE